MKTVLITGASSGIGRELAQQYLQAGDRVIGLARRLGMLQSLSVFAKHDGQFQAMEVDVSDERALRDAATRLSREGITLDTVIANAGFAVYGTFEELELEDYRRQFAVNVFGVLSTLKAMLPFLKETKGQFAVIGSVSGFIGLPRRSAYAMSKFALRGLCQSLAVELSTHGVGVTLISPGYVDTPTREVDNFGVHSPGVKNPAPEGLLFPCDRAARLIRRAIAARVSHAVISNHGKIAVLLSNLMPQLLTRILKRKWRRTAAV